MTDIVITPKVMDRINTSGVKGYVPVIDIEDDGTGQLQAVPKLTPWWNDPIWVNTDTGKLGWHPSYKPGASFAMPADAQERVMSRAAPDVRTSAREKFSALCNLLRAEARRFTTPDGTVMWPASVARDLSEAAWKQGKAGRLTTDEQVELLARNYIVHSARKQDENDGKTVTTAYHGHSAA